MRYTDDTHMTIGMAESLVDRGRFDGAHMAQVFARNFNQEPWRGYGPGPPQVFRLLSQRVPWDRAGRTLFGGRGSFGNGAAMRVAPAALFAFREMEEVVSLASKTALITHTHELGVEGAVVQACAVAMALQTAAAGPPDSRAFLDGLLGHVTSGVYQEKLEAAGRLLDAGRPPDRETVVSQLGNGIGAFESVPTAVYAFLRTPRSFEAVVTYAIGLGGDTDTIGCMAGAIAGACLGADGVPRRWREGVENAARLEELADSLFDVAVTGDRPAG